MTPQKPGKALFFVKKALLDFTMAYIKRVILTATTEEWR